MYSLRTAELCLTDGNISLTKKITASINQLEILLQTLDVIYTQQSTHKFHFPYYHTTIVDLIWENWDSFVQTALYSYLLFVSI